jgi:arsenate reductase (glutaredoxin)
VSIILYGIANCDTVKKARDWLTARGIAYVFHDYKKRGVDPAKLRAWAAVVAWDKLLNRAGTTFKKLPDADKMDLDAEKAIAIMVANPSCIKRPLLEYAGGILVGFKPDQWEASVK